MKKIKIFGEYNYRTDIKDDYYVDEEKQVERQIEIPDKTISSGYRIETVLETIIESVLVKGDYTLVDEADLVQIGITKKFAFDSDFETWHIVDMTPQEISEADNKRQECQTKAQKHQQIAALKAQLAPLQEDLVQVIAGQIIPNIEDKRAEFRRIHNEIRTLEGKLPRETETII